MSSDDFIRRIREQAFIARQSELEFQGFDREFSFYQSAMIQEFERTESIQHPGNRGGTREDLLRQLLTKQGLLPEKVGVSECSGRVFSNYGHRSDEIDILLYKKSDSFSLMKYPSVEFFPVDSVYGVIQVKSRIDSSRQLLSAMQNVASFKKLKKRMSTANEFGRFQVQHPVDRGFGIVFAYGSNLQWKTIVKSLEEFMKSNDSHLWPNAVCILGAGCLFILDKKLNQSSKLTKDIDCIQEGGVFGFPDRGDSLLHTYVTIMDNITRMSLAKPLFTDYIRLPLVSGDISYSYVIGEFSEVGECEKHGVFLRKMKEDKIHHFIDESRKNGLKHSGALLREAYGETLTQTGKEWTMGNVYLYNPDGFELNKILTHPKTNEILMEMIIIENEQYWLPLYYALKDDIMVIECPRCESKIAHLLEEE